MHTETVEAVVISLSDYGESDLIVTVFSREQGKFRGIARGARKSRKRFAGALEMFARLSLTVRPKEGLWGVDGADILSIHSGIRGDLHRIACASYAAELTDVFLPDSLTNPRYYRLLCAYLERLHTAPAQAAERRFFEINLLNILGYRPDLEGCGACGAPLAAGARLCGAELRCPACGRGGFPVSTPTLSGLSACLRTGRFGMVELQEGALAEAGRLLDALVASHAARHLRSLPFLQEMEGS
ncbi:MAG TPA: DNA repair protein RecO [Verrucomicrobiae bacterium]|nr:DNA repair protein RecO [Verrucomicrobiae bacterium]